MCLAPTNLAERYVKDHKGHFVKVEIEEIPPMTEGEAELAKGLDKLFEESNPI